MAHDTRLLAMERGVIAEDETYVSPLVRTISEYSLLFDLVHKNLRIAAGNSGPTEKLGGLPADIPADYLATLDDIRAELAARDVPLVASTYIVKYRRGQPRDEQVANADVAFYYMPWMSIEDLLDGIGLYNQALVTYGAAHDVPVIAETDSIPADAEHFVDCVHFSDAGCRLMAQRVHTFLDDEGIIAQLAGRLQP
jgi:lysophospholipase L1-like esterase